METVKYFADLKCEPSLSSVTRPFSAVSIEKTSPAPSQSEEVMIGGCVCVKSRSAKNLLSSAILCDRKRSRAELKGVRDRRCGIVRRNSEV